jgi:tetratricopeptide (TPR) repeat protein
MKVWIQLLLGLCLLVPSVMPDEGADALFRSATQAYEAQDPTTALAQWKELVYEDYDAFELWYNMGNAAWRLNQIPQAELYWQRAALHAPFDPDVAFNLNLAAQSHVDRVEEAPRLSIWKLFDRLFLSLPHGLPSALAQIFLWLGMGLLFASQMAWIAWKRRHLLFVTLALSILSFFALSFLGLRNWTFSKQNPAILMENEVVVRSAPALASTALFDLHAGVSVWIQNQSTDAQGRAWIEFRLADGRVGWGHSDHFVPVKSRRCPE